MEYTVNELRQQKKISERASNILAKRNITTIEDLVAFYLQYGTFEIIPQCGVKTNQELIALSQKYSDVVETVQDEMITGAFVESDETKSLLDDALRQIYESMPRKVQNVLNKDLKFDFNFDKSSLKYTRYFDKEFPTKFDKSPDNHIARFFETFSHLINIKNNLSSTFPEVLELGVWTYLNFGIEIHKIPALKKSLSEKSIKLFKLIDTLIKDGNKFNEKWTNVFYLKSDFIQHDKNLSLVEIGDMIGVTRERVRQIAVKVDKEFMEAIKQIGKLNKLPVNLSQYDFLKENDFIYLSSKQVDKLNRKEGVQFSHHAYMHILHLFYKDRYSLIRSDTDKFPEFLVKKELSDGFPFAKFLHHIYDLVSEPIDKDTILDIDILLSKYGINTKKPIAKQIRDICQYLIVDSYKHYIFKNKSGHLVLRQNTVVSIKDAIMDILMASQRPLHLDELVPLVSKRRNAESYAVTLRHIINKNDEFIAFGRTSTYGLAEWEDTKDGIKGGPIRDMIIEFLQQKSEPIYIYDILNHLWQYRPDTNEVSVNGNLQQDNRKRFIHIKHGYWGLSNKSYSKAVLEEIQSIPTRFSSILKNICMKNPGVTIDDIVNIFKERSNMNPSRIKSHLHNLTLRGDIRISKSEEVKWNQ